MQLPPDGKRVLKKFVLLFIGKLSKARILALNAASCTFSTIISFLFVLLI